jgi:hypothetical protein
MLVERERCVIFVIILKMCLVDFDSFFVVCVCLIRIGLLRYLKFTQTSVLSNVRRMIWLREELRRD